MSPHTCAQRSATRGFWNSKVVRLLASLIRVTLFVKATVDEVSSPPSNSYSCSTDSFDDSFHVLTHRLLLRSTYERK